MRTKVILIDAMREIICFYRYLYMNAENFVIVNNNLTDLKITMDEQLDFLVQNLSFPNSPPMRQELSLDTIVGIIEQLERQPPRADYETIFTNEWERIKAEVDTAMMLNLGGN